jgi:hypothetical protein
MQLATWIHFFYIVSDPAKPDRLDPAKPDPAKPAMRT